jgi:uncharacterized repeat protein (TIGR03803 family)
MRSGFQPYAKVRRGGRPNVRKRLTLGTFQPSGNLVFCEAIHPGEVGPFITRLGKGGGTMEATPYPSRRTASGSALAVAVLLLTLAPAALAQTETVLYTFLGGEDGATPLAGLVRGAKGNLYSTTSNGGTYGVGTVFKVSPNGTEKVLHTFTGGFDGGSPQASLILDSVGNLYGTSSEIVLYSFKGGTDGASPLASLIRDANGNLYGTTFSGGTLSHGTVFEVTSSGKERVLYSFTGGTDGGSPWGGLLKVGGVLYGTTAGGGTGYGTTFSLTLGGKETVLHTFDGADGESPEGSLVRDKNGNIFGITHTGGSSTDNPLCPGGCGTLYEISASDVMTTLHNFGGVGDGAYLAAGVVIDLNGNLYGATILGGNSTCGCGTVFKISPSGEELFLYSFPGGAEGIQPAGGVVLDGKGNLYGVTLEGGVNNIEDGYGVVFKITP